MSTIFRLHHNGGLAGDLTADGRTVPIVITWNNASACISLDEAADAGLSGTDLVGWLLAQIGSHAVEFSQALVSASPCLSVQDLQARATALSESLKPLASESGAAAPPADSAAPPQTVVAGVAIAPAAEKPARTRTRKSAAVTPVQVAPEPAPTVEVAPQAPPSVTVVTGTAQEPASDPRAFVEQMVDVAARQEAARSPAEPRFRQPEEAPSVAQAAGAQAQQPTVEEHRVVAEPDFLDQMVELLTVPPMPPDLFPADWQRSPADQRYADTALTRLAFRRCLELEYQQAGPGRHQPTMPAREHMIVDPSTPQGIAAFVQLLFAAHERAESRGIEIPQLAAWLSMYPGPDGLRAACESAWQRVEGRRQQAAQRLTAMQAQAQPVQTAPNYAAPQAHGQHPSYVPPQPTYQPQHQGPGGYAPPQYYPSR